MSISNSELVSAIDAICFSLLNVLNSSPALRRYLLSHTERAGGSIRQFVGADLVAMAAVAPDPLPSDGKACIQLDQLRPQFTVLQLGSAPISPALALPAEDKCAHS